MGKKEKPTQDQQVVNYIIKKGVESLVEEHPIFGNFQDYIVGHINQRGIWNKFNETYNNNLNKGMKPEDAKKSAYYAVENYVTSGNLLDEEGKKVILKEGLQEKTGFFRKVFHKEKLGEKYLNNTIKTFRDLGDLIKSRDYAQKMPEIAEAINTLENAEFYYAATRILKEGGYIDDKKQKYILNNIYKNLDEQPQKIISGLEKYVFPQKVAALIMSVVGLVLILLNLNITGAVIGGDSTITMGIAGIFMIFFALLIYLRPLKKSFKN
jgi:hypothetical protein